MRVEKIRDAIITPPVKEVVLHLTPKDYHDLLVIASIPFEPLIAALSAATYQTKAVDGCRTYDVHGLMRQIRKSEAQ